MLQYKVMIMKWDVSASDMVIAYKMARAMTTVLLRMSMHNKMANI